MRKIGIIITPQLSGKTVKSILTEQLKVSGTLIKRLKASDGILLNGEAVRITQRVQSGQKLEAVIDRDIDAVGKEPPFPILYQDSDVIIIDKPAGMLVHATKATFEEKTVAAYINEYLGSGHFHPISRLDRGTSGAMAIAKNGYTHTAMCNLLHTDKFSRTYLAIVCGKLKNKSGTIDMAIGRDEVSPIKRIISANGKPAVTEYEVLEENGAYSLVKVTPKTGRTHQIRLHFSAIGNPIVGDFLYGVEDKSIILGYALHSYSISFTSMENKKVEVFCNMPSDMRNIFYNSDYKNQS